MKPNWKQCAASLADALQALLDEQVDAPLARRRTQWNEAMKSARENLQEWAASISDDPDAIYLGSANRACRVVGLSADDLNRNILKHWRAAIDEMRRLAVEIEETAIAATTTASGGEGETNV